MCYFCVCRNLAEFVVKLLNILISKSFIYTITGMQFSKTLFLLSAGWCRTSWLGLLKRTPWSRLWWIPRGTSSTPARRRAPSASTTSGPMARPWRRSPAWRHRYGSAKRCVNMICCTHGEKAPSASPTSGPMARPWRRSPAWRHRQVWLRLMLCWYSMLHTWGGKSTLCLYDLGPNGEAMEKITSMTSQVWLG